MADRCVENVIEWATGDDEAYCTFSQKRFVNRIRKLSEKHAEHIKILAENEDGSVLARIPHRAIHLTIYAPNKAGFAGVADTIEELDEEEEC